MYGRDLKHLSKAIGIAMNNEYRWAHGCIIAKGQKLIIARPNRSRNNPTVCPDAATVHAEASAIKGALAKGVDLKGTTIYIARVGQTGDLRMSRPCPNCMDLIIGAEIRNIIYTNTIGSISEEKVADIVRSQNVLV